MGQFYIKLDKKLILSINDLTLTPRQKGGTDPLSQLHSIGDKLKWLPLLFERIHINNMSVGDFRLRAEYNGCTFHIVTDRIDLSARLQYHSAQRLFRADNLRLRLLKPDLRFDGHLRYTATKGEWEAEGSYEGLGLAGNISLKRQDDLVSFALNSQRVASLGPLVKELAVPRSIAVWMVDKIRAKGYLLKNLSGQIRLTAKGPQPLIKSLRGTAYAFGAAIRFHPDAPPVLTKRIRITFQNDTLFFDLKEPVFRKIPLAGSRVTIGPIIQRRSPPALTLTIRAKGPLDKRVTDLLALYRIPLPFRQTKGILDAETKLTFRLTDGKVTDYEGRYTAPSATLLFDDTLPVPVEDLNVTAKGKKFTIRSARIAYPPYLLADVSGTLALAQKKGDFALRIQKARYPAKSPLLSIQNDTRHITLDFNQDVRFTLPGLLAQATYRREGLKIRLDDLSRLAPYFDGPLKRIRGGQLTLTTRRQEIEGQLTLHYPNEIFTQKGKPLERFDIRFQSDTNGWQAQVNKIATLKGDSDKISVSYQNIDIRIPPLRRMLLHDRNGTTPNAPKVRLFGRHTTLYLDRASLPCDSLDLLIIPRPFSLSFLSRHADGTIKGALYNQKLQVTGKNLPARVIRSVSALHDLYGGYFNFDAVGTLDDFSGAIDFYDTLWAKSATYNNILATLNTVPALLSLKNPGFNRKGFKIKKGQILYRYKAPTFTFKQIAVHGESADIFGSGQMNLDTGEIHAALQIRFLETVTNLMQKIPVAGYLLFGKEGNIAIGLHIDGPVKNPEVKTDTVKNIVTAPFNIIRRTITLPFHLDEAF